MTALPVDIWLLVFDAVNDLDTLWSVLRNVSRFLRDCVDEHFRHGIVQSALIDLHYSTINRHCGPTFHHVHVPMRFSTFAEDGRHAVFRQVEFNLRDNPFESGSPRGWVPFVERYYEETRHRGPIVLNKTTSAHDGPLWKKEHSTMRNTLVGQDKRAYLAALRDHTTIGRGDRPPFYLKIGPQINDTRLVDLAINCQTREISFDWRRTFSAFFVEWHYLSLAYSKPNKNPTHDEDLLLVAARLGYSNYNRENLGYKRRARRKRLLGWVKKNRHLMTPEHRLQTEYLAESTKSLIKLCLREVNLRELRDDDMCEEYVPERCAEGDSSFMWYPWVGDDFYFKPKTKFSLGPKRCTVM